MCNNPFRRTRSGTVPPAAKRQRGATLVEVMIAVFILAVGLLGVAALQASALRNSGSALERSQAVIQTYSILDAMRANNAGGAMIARTGGYNRAFTAAAGGGNPLATADITAWLNSLRATLGQSADGQINCAAAVCTISVRWDDSRGTIDTTAAAVAAAAAYQVTTVSQL